MRLGLDVHMLGERHTGVAVYVSELLSELLRQLDDRPALTLELFGKPADAARIRDRHPIDHPRVRWTPVGGRRLWTSVHLPWHCAVHRRALRERLDVLLFPAHHVPAGLPVPAMVTVLDCGFEKYPETFLRRDVLRLRWMTRAAVRRARGVLAISECTARDVAECYGVPRERIWVTPLGAGAARVAPGGDPARRARLRSKYGIRGDYVLAVGTLQPRKNYARLMQAVARVRELGTNVQLVVSGGDGWLAGEIHAARAALPDPSAVVLAGYTPADDLAELYAGARVSAQVGLYEGFGLPVLEAFAAGVPTLVARSGALPEVAGTAALQVDPQDTAAIAEALDRLLRDDELRRALQARMPVRLREFTWRRTVDRTLAAVREAVGA